VKKLAKINPNKIFIQLLLVFFFLLIPETGIPQDDVFLGVDIPIYPGATDIRHYNEKANKTVTYWICTNYPAPELLEYYDSQLNSRGWSSCFETCQRKWYEEPDKQASNGSMINKLFASWQHTELGLTFSLWLINSPQKQSAIRKIFVKIQVGH
jgi:hypothetical protein